MEVFVLDHHVQSCNSNRPKKEIYKDSWDFFVDHGCEMNPRTVLLYAQGDFYLINYFGCVEGFQHLDFKENLVRQIFTKTKTCRYYLVQRENYDKGLMDFRVRNKPLKKWAAEVNYIYEGVGSTYAITTRVPYVNALCFQDTLRDNYEKAKEYISENNPHLLKELKELYFANIGYTPSDARVHKTIDKLITDINKLINQ